MNREINNIKIETYKGIDLIYSKQNGRILFNFEGTEREAKYVFEARQIIDEPIWEVCNLKGYFIDGTFNDFIGEAIAKRKNTKDEKPDWEFKGKYNLDYKKHNFSNNTKVYPLTPKNLEIYEEFENQRKVALKEERKLKDIISKLTPK